MSCRPSEQGAAFGRVWHAELCLKVRCWDADSAREIWCGGGWKVAVVAPVDIMLGAPLVTAFENSEMIFCSCFFLCSLFAGAAPKTGSISGTDFGAPRGEGRLSAFTSGRPDLGPRDGPKFWSTLRRRLTTRFSSISVCAPSRRPSVVFETCFFFLFHRCDKRYLREGGLTQ